MEVRCEKCNKLFRVSDDKITGSGIKFACSKCGEYVKITPEDFEHYKLSQETASLLASYEPKPKPGKVPVEPAQAAGSSAPAASALDFDLSEPPQAEFTREEEAAPAFIPPSPPMELAPEVVQPRPEPVAQPKAAPKPESKTKPSVEPKAEPKPKVAAPLVRPEAAPKPAAASMPEATAIPPVAFPEHADETAPAASAAASSHTGKRLGIFITVILVAVAAAVFVAKWYVGQGTQVGSKPGQTITTAEGLHIKNPSAVIDPVNQDLVITGVIENATDKPRPVWLVVAEASDEQGKILIRAKVLNGKQLYTRRDFDMLARRGHNIEDIKKKLQEQGIMLPPGGRANFEIRIMEPPAGVASFNVAPQPFDPVQLFKEIAEDQKQK